MYPLSRSESAGYDVQALPLLPACRPALQAALARIAELESALETAAKHHEQQAADVQAALQQEHAEQVNQLQVRTFQTLYASWFLDENSSPGAASLGHNTTGCCGCTWLMWPAALD